MNNLAYKTIVLVFIVITVSLSVFVIFQHETKQPTETGNTITYIIENRTYVIENKTYITENITYIIENEPLSREEIIELNLTYEELPDINKKIIQCTEMAIQDNMIGEYSPEKECCLCTETTSWATEGECCYPYRGK